MRGRFLVSLALLLALVACGGGFTDPSKNTTEPFTGTVQPGAGNFGAVHTFNVSKLGEFTVTLTALTPTFAGFVTVIYGQQAAGSCQPLGTNNFVRVGTQALGGTIQPATYCVALFDQGTFTTAETYTLTVNHP